MPITKSSPRSDSFERPLDAPTPGSLIAELARSWGVDLNAVEHPAVEALHREDDDDQPVWRRRVA